MKPKPSTSFIFKQIHSKEDFERNHLNLIDIDKLIETQQAQICVMKCKKPENLFNRATILNNLAAGVFIDKCLSSVGIKDFRSF